MRARCVIGVVLCGWMAATVAQTPSKKDTGVEERAGASGTTPSLQQQQRVSAAWRALTQARHDAKLAEQDYVNTQDAYVAAQKRADALKADLDKAGKAREAARAREAAANKTYEDELKR